MKYKSKLNLIIIIMFLFQILSTSFISVKAAEISSNLDVIFVLDASGSMKKSDPEDIRIEAIKMFLDMAQTKGNKVGLVAYSDNIVREHNLNNIDSDNDKNRIKNMASNIPFGQKTDTGAGLLEGVKLLDSEHNKSHRPVIVLLSDGKNDPLRNNSESLNDLNKAIDICKEKGYPVYTIGLNYDGTVDKAQLSQISTGTKGKNYITNSAADIPKILTDIYADNSKLKVQDKGTLKLNGSFQEMKINIPNSNVLEANVAMISDKPVEVKLINPKGEESKIPSSNAILTSSKKYSMLKIMKPQVGDWTLKVKGVSGSDIKVSYVFNYDIQLEGKFTPSNGKEGDKVNIESYFVNNGEKVSDKELYNGVKGRLIVKSLKDDSTKEVPLTVEGTKFIGEYTIPDKGKYELKVRVDGNSFYRESAPVVMGGTKATPTVNDTPKESVVKKPLFLGIIGAVVLAITSAIIIIITKKKRVRGFGRVEINIKDENTNEILPPQFRSLKGYQGSFSLFEVLGLKEEYEETEGIRFIFRNDDSIEVINKSECTIQKSGRKLNKDSNIRLYNGNKITMQLNKISKSITMEFYSK
ncbi:Mg-chelatase subunit ChlD [Clostridium tetanomorphum]|uniref:vWA domain-containing protein n=1 Tax=Clostridium tetanomorphum TaxID=1553 RepID=UPI0005553D5E|nr:vWA domain-containing protein [Clostridium tetanomorphum]MBP1864628.1 Mg-chelatase subunit ChlD [Clostridium tetanomorphum]NRS84098.1 Mg-chelatase subunit ChlD [Clostridium tetanomorphum]NRZ97311.1 Mg-chelatase subunit ChlD [Clostridium tetanomorphum]